MYMYECTVPNGKKNYICVFSTRVMERMHKQIKINIIVSFDIHTMAMTCAVYAVSGIGQIIYS